MRRGKSRKIGKNSSTPRFPDFPDFLKKRLASLHAPLDAPGISGSKPQLHYLLQLSNSKLRLFGNIFKNLSRTFRTLTN